MCVVNSVQFRGVSVYAGVSFKLSKLMGMISPEVVALLTNYCNYSAYCQVVHKANVYVEIIVTLSLIHI